MMIVGDPILGSGELYRIFFISTHRAREHRVCIRVRGFSEVWITIMSSRTVRVRLPIDDRFILGEISSRLWYTGNIIISLLVWRNTAHSPEWIRITWGIDYPHFCPWASHHYHSLPSPDIPVPRISEHLGDYQKRRLPNKDSSSSELHLGTYQKLL